LNAQLGYCGALIRILFTRVIKRNTMSFSC